MEKDVSLVDRYSLLFKIIDDEDLLRKHFPAHIGQAVWISAQKCNDKEKAKQLYELAKLIMPDQNHECKSLDMLEQEGFDEDKYYKRLKELLT